MTSDSELLESVLGKTTALIAGVRPDQAHLPTPCTDYDVEQVVAHQVGWASKFAAQLTDQPFEGDPNAFQPGPEPAAEFGQAASVIVGAYQRGGEAAERVPLRLLLMEYLTHGWDVAVATGQPVPYTSDEAEPALAMAQGMLKPEYRGPGKAFGYEAEVAESAGTVDRLIACSGRSPDWAPSSG